MSETAGEQAGLQPIMLLRPITRQASYQPRAAFISRKGYTVMQVKIYVPHTVEVPSEYLAALAQRAQAALEEPGRDVSATRGQLVRQAVRDGLLRELDHLLAEDGTVDVICDPGSETPLKIENRTVRLAELGETLQNRRNWSLSKADDAEELRAVILPRRKAA